MRRTFGAIAALPVAEPDVGLAVAAGAVAAAAVARAAQVLSAPQRQVLVGRVERREQVEHLVHHLGGARVGGDLAGSGRQPARQLRT